MPTELNITGPNNEININATENKVVVVEGGNVDINVTQPITNVVEILTGPIGPRGDLPTSGSINFTGSYIISGSLVVSGSIISTEGFTGSLFGTSSWAINTETSSYINPLNQNVIITGSLTVSGSSTFTNIGPAIFSGSVTSRDGFTGSFLGNLIGTSSYIAFSSVDGLPTFSSSVSSRIMSLENFSSSLDTTFVTETQLNLYTSSVNTRLDILEIESGSIRSSFNNFTASYTIDSGSFTSRINTNTTNIANLTSATSSYVLNSQTGSFILLSQTSSMSVASASYVNISDIDGFISYSSSVSTRIVNLENFSSSLDATFITNTELNSATSSLSASISYLSSSYLVDSASFNNKINNNINGISLLSSSFISFSGSYNTGSFTGSFVGDGSQLTGIVSSKWSGSNPITRESDVEITGSFSVSGSTSLIGPINTNVLEMNADELIMTGSFQLSGSMEIVGLIIGTSSFSLTSSYIDGGFF